MKRALIITMTLLILWPPMTLASIGFISPKSGDEWQAGKTYTIKMKCSDKTWAMVLEHTYDITFYPAYEHCPPGLIADSNHFEHPIWEECDCPPSTPHPYYKCMCTQWTIPNQLGCGLGKEYRIRVWTSKAIFKSEPFTIAENTSQQSGASGGTHIKPGALSNKPHAAMNYPDLVVSEYETVTLKPGEKAPDGTVSNHKRYYFVWTVKNIGEKVAPPTKLKIECQAWNKAACPPGTNKSYDIPTLWPRPDTVSGAVKIWNEPPFEPTSRAQFNFKATVDPDNQIVEKNETNNTLLSGFDSGAPSVGPVEKAIKALKFDVLSPRENYTYYHPVHFKVIMPKKTRKIYLRIGKKDPNTNSWDTDWMLFNVDRNGFTDKGAYYLWEKTIALPPTDYYFIARPNDPNIPKGPAAADKDGIQFRVAPLSEKPHFSSKVGKHLAQPSAAPSTRTSLAHLKPSQTLRPNKSGTHTRFYGAGGDPSRGKTEKAHSHAKGVQAALKITPPVITSLRGGETFTAPATLKLKSKHAPGQNVTYELQKKDKSGRFHTLRTSPSGDFHNLKPGFYRVRALYAKRNLPASKWVTFEVKTKVMLRKLPTSNSKIKPGKIHVPQVK